MTSTQKDRDYIVAVNWKAAEKAVKAGKVKTIGGVPVIDPKMAPGFVYLIPAAKSPHGVDVTPGRQVHHRQRQTPVDHDRFQL